MNTLPFSELVEINPRVKIEKAKEYLFVEMGIVEPGRSEPYIPRWWSEILAWGYFVRKDNSLS